MMVSTVFRPSTSVKNPILANSNSQPPRLPIAEVCEDVPAIVSGGNNPRFEAGYLLGEQDSCPFNTFEDYRGLTTTISTNVSRNKADAICRWADIALDELERMGGVYFNPQCPSLWPQELLCIYELTATDLVEKPSKRRPEAKMVMTPWS